MAQQSEWVVGATTYKRMSQDNVDYAVPNGRTVEDRDFIYIIKMDNKSGRNYFVQATTRQKSWELPDQSGGAAAGGRSYRERVTLIYKTYNPEKIGSVDIALERYKGNEEQLIADLVQKYGPEPQPAPSSESSSKPPPTPTQGGDDRAAIRQRLVRFYEKYNAEKVATVDKALDAYAGQYDAMFAALVEKYGPEPPAPDASREETRARLVRFYEQYNKEKLATVDKALDAYVGQYDAMFAALVEKYGPEPPAPGGASPAASTSTPPSNVTAAPAGAAASSPATTAERSMEDRVRAMCKHYKPKKPDLADKYLAQYKGQEEELMKVLVQKYGPEPASNTTPPASQNPSESGSFAGSVNTASSPTPAAASPAAEQQSPAQTATTESTPPASGGESPAAAAAAPASTGGNSPAKAAPKERSLEDRVRAMCKHYKPKKPDLADKYLAQYKGQEADLLKTLTDKFGPEPPAEDEPAQAAEDASPAAAAGDSAAPATVAQESASPTKEGAAEASQPVEKQGESAEQPAVAESNPQPATTTTPEKKTEQQPEQPKTASTFDFGENRGQAPSLEQVQAAIGKSGSNQEQLLVTFIQDRDERLRQAHTRTEQYTATLDELRAQSAALQKQLNEVKAQSDLEVQGMKAHSTKIQEETEFAKQSWELEREKLKAQADVAALVAEKTVQEEKVQFEKDRAEFQKLQASLEEQLATLQYDILQREKQSSKMLELLDTKDQDVRSLNDELAMLKAEARHAPTHSVETQTENEEGPESPAEKPQQTMREVEEQVSAIVNEVGGEKSPSNSPQQQPRSLNLNATTDLNGTLNNTFSGTASSLPGAFMGAPQGNLTSAEDEALFAEYETLMQGERNRRDELEEWKRKARLLEREVQRLRSQSVLQTSTQSQEDNNKKLKVIVQLRAKIKKLEDKVADLEMSLLALPSEPAPSTRSASGTPTTAELLSEKSSLESQVNLLQKELSETKNVARSQRREIADLRGLLSIHRSSPAGGLRAALGATSPSTGSAKKKDVNDNKQQAQKPKGTMGTAKRTL